MRQRKTPYVYDIETLINYHCFVFYPVDSDEYKEFSLHYSNFELDELVTFLTSGIALIGYNVLRFDGQVIQFILDQYPIWKKRSTPIKDIIDDIYRFAQRVIDLTNAGEFPPYPEWKIKIDHLDLFTIWHFDNMAKATSLKWLQFMMNWHDLREMPIHHNEKVTKEQIPDILFYCHNDVKSTRVVYQITKGDTKLKLYEGVDKVALRKDLMIEAGFDKRILNWNDVKIGDKLNEKKYLELTGMKNRNELYELKHKYKRTGTFTFGDCIPEYVKFKTKKFQDFYNMIKDIVVDTIGSDDKSTQKFNFELNGTSYTVARGGIHSEDPYRIVIPKENEILLDADVGSQYPNAMRKGGRYPLHLGPVWLQLVTGNIQKRLDSKKAYKATGDKKHQSINEAYKLGLNGGLFGKTGEATSWQHDLYVHFGCTIMNQFEILMLIEMLEEAGIHVISANTDGIVCLFDRSLINTYYDICHQWEKIVGNDDLGQLEYQEYTKYVQLSVNDYLAIQPDGKVKKKGDFMTDFELHKNKSFRVIPMALEAYFVKGEDPNDFIREHWKRDPENIFDYCRGIRAKGQWFFEARDVKSTQLTMFEGITSDKMAYRKSGEKLQKTIRYFMSNEGKKILKCHADGRAQEMEAGSWLATVFNVYEEREEYDINYTFYLEKIYEKIKKLETPKFNL